MRKPAPAGKRRLCHIARSICAIVFALLMIGCGRPAGVISARVVRPSVGCGTRRSRPCCSKRSTALVTLVGWTWSREPSLLSGNEPRRLKSSTMSSS